MAEVHKNNTSGNGHNLEKQKCNGRKCDGVTLYVGGIPSSLNIEALKAMFSQAGNVLSVKLYNKRPDQQAQYGFITMSTVQEAEQAIHKFNNFSVNKGRYQLTVSLAKTQNKQCNQQQLVNEDPKSQSEVKPRSPSSESGQNRKNVTLQCTVCHQSASKRCNKCKTPYCSRKCQERDWATHKHICSASFKKIDKPLLASPTESVITHESDFENRFEITIDQDATASFIDSTTQQLTDDKGNEPNFVSDTSDACGMASDVELKNLRKYLKGKEREEPTKLVKEKVKLEEKEEVIMNLFTHPSDFWVTPVATFSSLKKLLAKLNEFYSNHPADLSYIPKPGEICVAKFSENKQWYRCQVDLVQNNNIRVTCIDTGNSEVLPVNLVQRLQPAFTELPMQAVHCTLFGIEPVGGIWSGEALKYAQSLMPVSKTFHISVKQNRNGMTSVDIFNAEGTNVSELLIAEGHAKYITGEVQHKQAPAAKKTPSLTHSDKLDYVMSTQEMRPESKMIPKNDVMSSRTTPQSEVALTKAEECKSEVTLQKETVVEKDKESFKQLFTLTKHMVLENLQIGSTVPMQVNVIDSPSSFWVQIISEQTKKEFQMLMEEMNSFYNQQPTDSEFFLNPGEICASMYSEDKRWYRAQVLQVENDKVSVLYLDYGNHEMVPFSYIHALETTFRKLPFQAVCCSLFGLSGTEKNGTWNDEALKFFVENIVLSKSMMIVKKDGMLCKVKVKLPDGTMLNDKLLQHKMAILVPEFVPTEEMGKDDDLHRNDINRKMGVMDLPAHGFEDHTTLARVTHAPDVNHIVVQVFSGEYKAYLKAVHLVMDNYTPARTTFQPKLGELVAAKYSLDNQWYRAEVKEFNSMSKHHVYYIDYGNEEDLDTTCIAPLPKDMYKYPALGISCSMAGITSGDVWFKDLLENQTFYLEVGDRVSGEKLIIKLFNPETKQLINDQLVELGYAIRCKSDKTIHAKETHIEMTSRNPTASIKPCLESSEKTDSASDKHPSDREIECSQIPGYCKRLKDTGRIMASSIPHLTVNSEEVRAACVHFESCTEFYIMVFEKDVPTMVEEMNSKLQVTYSDKEKAADDMTHIYVPACGELVAAYSSEHSCWYRAEVLNYNKNEVCVRYIDFGNNEMIKPSHVCQLRLEFANVPVMALHCCLKEDLAILNKDEVVKVFCNKPFLFKINASHNMKNSYVVEDVMELSNLTSVIGEMIKNGTLIKKPDNLGTRQSHESLVYDIPEVKSAGIVTEDKTLSDHELDGFVPGQPMEKNESQVINRLLKEQELLKSEIKYLHEELRKMKVTMLELLKKS